jgi:uncharacterized protein DUF3800
VGTFASGEYSVVRHMCWGILLNHDPAATWIAIMTEYAAYFDDSGHPDDQPYVVVAGFISSEEQWLIFEREWREDLQPFGIDVFHMADFESSRLWTREKKNELLRKLIATIRVRTRFHIDHIVPMDMYRQINEKYAFEEVIGTPYALAGRTVAKSINEWKQKYMKSGDKLLVFFEDGTKHKGDFMDAMARDKLPCPVFIKKSDAVSLQAADLAAWECFEAIQTSTTKIPIFRPEFKFMMREPYPFDSGCYTLENMEEMCRAIPEPIPLRANMAPGTQIAQWNNPKKLRRRTIR